MRMFVLCLLMVCAQVGVAETRDSRAVAKQLYTEGTRQYDLNDYGKALDLFRRAYLAYEEPSLLFNIAQCQRQLGQKDDAVKSYRSYLRKLPNASNRAEVERLVTRLEEAIANEQRAVAEPPHEVQPATPAPPALVEQPAPAPAVAKTPVYKKWWLWTIVGVVVVGGAVGAGVGIALSQPSWKKTLPDIGPGSTMSLTARF